MKELMRRLSAHPFITGELLAASFFANLLALASSLFVIQVLQRYVSYGVDSTLATLTLGVIAAIVLEFIFRQVRLVLVSEHLSEADERWAIGAFGIMTTAKISALESLPAGKRREILRGLDQVETTYNGANISTLMDIPFAFLFLLALTLLNTTLGAVAFLFIIGANGYHLYSRKRLAEPTRELSETAAVGNALIATSNRISDTIRAFNGGNLLMQSWARYVKKSQGLRAHIGRRQGQAQSFSQSLQALMGVAVIAIGAMLVVAGDLDVSVLIGANIMAARALGPISRYAQLNEQLTKATQTIENLNELTNLDVERDKGTQIKNYKGGIEFKDMSFAFGESTSPLFESLSFKVNPGAVIMVTGKNGTGKTTLCRILMGLLDPTRGKILVDNVDLAQTVPAWWRTQVAYLPQEPNFINASIRDNLLSTNPELNNEDLNRCIHEAGLASFVNESADGLETQITDNGYTLSLGIRRRLALARALTSEGKLVIFDDPTEGMDDEGRAAVFNVMKTLSKQGRTMIITTADPQILRGARLVLDLNSKPVPTLKRIAASSRPKLVKEEQS